VEGVLELSAGDDVIAARGRIFGSRDGREIRQDRDGAIEVMRGFLNG